MRPTTLGHLFSLKPDGPNDRADDAHHRQPQQQHRNSSVCNVSQGGWAVSDNSNRRKILNTRLRNFLRPIDPKADPVKAFHASIDRSHDSCFIKPRARCPPSNAAVMPYPTLVQEVDRLLERSAARARTPLEHVVALTMRSTQDADGSDSSQAMLERAHALMQRLNLFEQLLDEALWEQFASTVAPGCPYTLQSFIKAVSGGFYGCPEMNLPPRVLGQSFFLNNPRYKDELNTFLVQGDAGNALRHAIVRLERYVYKTIIDAKTTLHVAMENIKLSHDTALLIGHIIPQDVQRPNALMNDQSKNPLLPPAAPIKGSDLELKQSLLRDYVNMANIKGLVQDVTHESNASDRVDSDDVCLAAVVKRINGVPEPHQSHLTQSDTERAERGGCHTTIDNLIDHGDFSQRQTLEDATPTHAIERYGSISKFVLNIFTDKRASQARLQERLDGRMVSWLVENLKRKIPRVVRNRNLVAFANGVVYQDGRFDGMHDVGSSTPVFVSAVKMINNSCRRTAHALVEEFFDSSHLPTKTIDKILNDQNWTDATKRSFFFMVGRARFKVGHDPLQVMVNVEGVSGSGKSSLVKAIGTYYDDRVDMATLVTRGEKTFGLGPWAKKFILIGPDVGENLTLIYKSDTNFNMARRVVHFTFGVVPDRQTTLGETFNRYECPTALVKMLKIYNHDLTHVVGSRSFWVSEASLQVAREFRTKFLIQANVLEALLRSSQIIMSPLVSVKVACIEKDDRGLTRREKELLQQQFRPFDGNVEALEHGEAPQFGYQTTNVGNGEVSFTTESNIMTLDELLLCLKTFCAERRLDCPAVTAQSFMDRFARYGIKSIASKVAVYFIGIRKGVFEVHEPNTHRGPKRRHQ